MFKTLLMVLGLIILTGSSVWLFSYHTDDDRPSNCRDEECFQAHFSDCQAATLTDRLGPGQSELTILGPDLDGCRVKLKFSDHPNPDLIGQPLECSLDNAIHFRPAWQSTLEALTTGTELNCRGPLLDRLPALNS